jgi:hypothetical protein
LTSYTRDQNIRLEKTGDTNVESEYPENINLSWCINEIEEINNKINKFIILNKAKNTGKIKPYEIKKKFCNNNEISEIKQSKYEDEIVATIDGEECKVLHLLEKTNRCGRIEGILRVLIRSTD